MLFPIAVADIELSDPLATIEGLGGYLGLRALVRLHGTPIGTVSLPVINGTCPAAAQATAILDQLSEAIVHHLLVDLLAAPYDAERWRIRSLLDVPHAASGGQQPSVTVAVCTRDRAADLEHCLEALNRLDYPELEILIVDNAPATEDTETLVHEKFPCVRYVKEARPGLDWARNRAVSEAQGEIIAFTDDDVVVDPGWVRALAAVFSEEPEVMAVTGLVWPLEIETEAQALFERYGGFGRGFRRRWYWTDPSHRFPSAWLGAGQFGTGANMAFRRRLFDLVGLFDPALDVGTVTNGGGDLEMFFRVLKHGSPLVYEPSALVRHRHRRDYAQLHTQIANNGVGFYSYLVRTALVYPDVRLACVRFGLWWFWWNSVRRWLISLVLPGRLPREIILAEMRGVLTGLVQYPKARRTAAKIASRSDIPVHPVAATRRPSTTHGNAVGGAVAVRKVELDAPLQPLVDVAAYAATRVYVIVDDRPVGAVEIANHYRPISVIRLREAIADQCRTDLLDRDQGVNSASHWARMRTTLEERLCQSVNDGALPETLPNTIPVSIVVATYDRPDQLRECLLALRSLKSDRPVEIIVVDNHPTSGLTSPVVNDFPGVVLVFEPRAGLAYARNRGITTSTGDIVIATDDDVLVPAGWLERLLAPFAQADVMAVTGNTLPLELETSSQVLFEAYGGLGRGFERRIFDQAWFERFHRRAVPTWELGATANAAFRSSVFADPAVGLMDEALGPGTATGVGEDTYLFYKILKAGYTIVYEPSAYAWHTHRREMGALQRQIYNYSKGHVAYHLTTLLRDHDIRVVPYLGIHLPAWRVRQVLSRTKRLLRRKGYGPSGKYPWRLIWEEVKGNAAGPWGLWQSRMRVGRDGRSDSYVPVALRPSGRPPAVAESMEPRTAFGND